MYLYSVHSLFLSYDILFRSMSHIFWPRHVSFTMAVSQYPSREVQTCVLGSADLLVRLGSRNFRGREYGSTVVRRLERVASRCELVDAVKGILGNLL